MATTVFQKSLTAGELSPSLYARTDVEKYQSAAALLRNWYVDYRGGASTRPGTLFVGQCKTGLFGIPRLIPFIVSTAATYVLEFGHLYIRFISNGAYVDDPMSPGNPLEVASPYSVLDLPTLKYTQSANVLSLVHPSYPPYELRRTGAAAFTLTTKSIGPDIQPPGAVSTGHVNGTGNTLLYGYVVTAVSDSGEESQASYPNFVTGGLLNQNTGIVNNIFFTGSTGAVLYKIYKVGPTPSGNGNNSTPPPTTFGFIGTSPNTSFVDNNIAPDYSQTPPTYQDPFSPGQIARVSVASGGSGYTGYSVPLIFTGDGSGATGYAIINVDSGTVAGVVLTNPGRSYTTVAVTDAGANTAVYTVNLGQQSGTYPAAVGYYQQRQAFGGTPNFPESMVLSQPGAYNNFDTSPISLSTDAITASLASREVNAIKAFVAMPTGLIVLTTGGGFLVSGGSAEAAITPSSISALPQASSGCNDMPPLVVNYDVLYCQNRGAVVRDLAFNFYVQSYTGTDRSVLASHLFTNYTLQEWTYVEEPFRFVQVVRNDGYLLNLTYVPEQEIFGWTQWATQGYYRSVCSIPEGQINAVYVVAERLIQNTIVFYVERFDSRQWAMIEDSWCLDCALDLPGHYPNDAINLQDTLGGHGLLGEYILINSAASTFSVGDVGKTFWAGTGRATVTDYIAANQIRAQVVKPFPRRPEQPTVYAFFAPGEWRLDPPVSLISGLSYLEGQTVSALADGIPVEGLVVTAGSVTLPTPATKVIVGLPYTCDFKSLRIDAGDPTIQGRRKMIPNLSIIVNQSAGLLIGPDFDNLESMVDLQSVFPPEWRSMIAYNLIGGQWTEDGQFVIRQSQPLPATILGLLPEVVVGDTGR